MIDNIDHLIVAVDDLAVAKKSLTKIIGSEINKLKLVTGQDTSDFSCI